MRLIPTVPLAASSSRTPLVHHTLFSLSNLNDTFLFLLYTCISLTCRVFSKCGFIVFYVLHVQTMFSHITVRLIRTNNKMLFSSCYLYLFVAGTFTFSVIFYVLIFLLFCFEKETPRLSI